MRKLLRARTVRTALLGLAALAGAWYAGAGVTDAAATTRSGKPRVALTASVSPTKVLTARGRVRPGRSGWKVRIYARRSVVRGFKAQMRWVKVADSARLGRSGRFTVRAPAGGPALTVRAVVLGRHGRIVTRSRTIVAARRSEAAGSVPAANVSRPAREPRGHPGAVQAAMAAGPGATLASGETLAAGAQLRSRDGRHRLVMQADGNLVLLRDTTVLWSSGGQWGAGSRAVMQADGNLVILSGTTPRWSTNTAGFAGARLALQDDGNLVIYHLGRAIWTWSAGYFGNRLDAGVELAPNGVVRSADGQYRLVMQSGDGNLVLYRGETPRWAGGAHGAGSRAVMQDDGNLVILSGPAARWSTNTADFGGAGLVVQDDGNAVIYHAGHAIWASSSGYIGDRLLPGATLVPGAYLKSPNHQYTLVMQATDGNLALNGPSGPIWGWGTNGRPTNRAVMQADGNLVVYEGNVPVKHTSTGGKPGAFVRLQDDANLVVYLGATPLWDRGRGLLLGGPSGPYALPNSGIADRAELRATGATVGQCLAFAADMIAEAGGPRFSFGDDTNTYQSQWAQRATQVTSLADARRGDIVQWGGGIGGQPDPHTAIVVAAGADPQIIDSNWGRDGRVRRGSFSSRNGSRGAYRIWRVGRM